ncbi:MAG: response regulator [Planctomycetota bacterium]|jgi:two-component system uhpT operon response regulator UhpA
MTRHDARTIRILCVDDHAFLIEGFRARIDVEPDLEVVGALERADRLQEVVEGLKPDIVLMDIEMPGADPFDSIDRLRKLHPEVRTILFSAFVRDAYLDAAYRAGAWGYLSKSAAPDEVIAGIRNVASGELAFTGDVLRKSNTPAGTRGLPTSRLSALSVRELQILRLIARGLTRTDIATQLSRSPMTIDNHRKSIMKKLGLSDRAELVRYAIAEGIVEV